MLRYAELAGFGNVQRTDWVVAVGEVWDSLYNYTIQPWLVHKDNRLLRTRGRYKNEGEKEENEPVDVQKPWRSSRTPSFDQLVFLLLPSPRPPR